MSLQRCCIFYGRVEYTVCSQLVIILSEWALWQSWVLCDLNRFLEVVCYLMTPSKYWTWLVTLWFGQIETQREGRGWDEWKHTFILFCRLVGLCPRAPLRWLIAQVLQAVLTYLCRGPEPANTHRTHCTLIWQRAANTEESLYEMRARLHAGRYEYNNRERKLHKQAQQSIQRQTAALWTTSNPKPLNVVILEVWLRNCSL